jgi:hypothetical protein
MTRTSRNRIASSLVALGMFGVPAIASAQSSRYVDDDRPSVVVQCAPGQRAVMENRRGQVVARCVGSRRVADGGYQRARYARPVAYDTYRPARSQYYERGPRRTKTKSALLIAGSAASGAGIGGALKGTKGALIGAAIGGGAASIYDASQRW